MRSTWPTRRRWCSTQAGIVIAFLQRDLNLDTRKALRVTLEDARQVWPLDPKSRQGGPQADPP